MVFYISFFYGWFWINVYVGFDQVIVECGCDPVDKTLKFSLDILDLICSKNLGKTS